MTNGTAQEVLIYTGDGTGQFTSSDTIPLGTDGLTFALATADLDRNGQPDFVSGAVDSGTIILGYSGLPDEPILPEEMAVTGYSTVTVHLTDPLGYELSRYYQTIAGGEVWEVDVNGDDTLDDQLLNYNLMNGEYRIGIDLKPGVDPGDNPMFAAGIRIDGSQALIFFHDYIFDVGQRSSESQDGMVFYYTVEEESSMFPPNGVQAHTQLLGFAWNKLIDSTGIEKYHFQLDPYYDFRNPIVDNDTLVNPYIVLDQPLGLDSVFYWRVDAYDGISWLGYTRTFAVYIASAGCCEQLRGNVDNITNTGGPIDVADLTYLVAYLFQGGPMPPCEAEANVDGVVGSAGSIDVSDLTYLVAYLFQGGTPPAPCW